VCGVCVVSCGWVPSSNGLSSCGEEARVACDELKWISRGTCSLPWTLELYSFWHSTVLVKSETVE
jgi:hypothetical protein